jgi:uncharacterized membrane protein YhaH (DUF805 family)
MAKPVFRRLFAISGRRGRLSYSIVSLIFLATLCILWYAVSAMNRPGWTEGAYLLAVLITIPIALSNWLVAAQRCRDFNWSGAAVVFTMVPLVGWLLAVALFFIPGDTGPNRFGPDPIDDAPEPGAA